MLETHVLRDEHQIRAKGKGFSSTLPGSVQQPDAAHSLVQSTITLKCFPLTNRPFDIFVSS